MDDLISRQAAISICDNAIDLWNGQLGTGALVAVRDAIMALPSAQPEIIRCKYCRHGVDYYQEGDCYCTNPKWGLKYFGGSWEFYCADAERKA